jgi:hypothetical protein
MPILKWNSKPIAAASAKNVEYISRDSVCDSLSFYNIEELEIGDRQNNKTNAIAYAEERMEQEKDKRGDRNHYRFVLTFDRDVPTEEARAEAYKYLEKEFPNAKAIVAVHQEKNKNPDKADGKFTHVHIWMDCRDKETGKKLNINNQKFKTMDERWTRQYDEKYGTNYEKQFKELKKETEQWKKEYAYAKQNNLELPEKPQRVADSYFKNNKEKYAEKDKEAAGITYDKNGIGKLDSIDSAGQRIINSREQAINRANSAADAAIREIDGLYKGLENLPTRPIPNQDLSRN